MIESATPHDLPRIHALLERLRLPLAGVDAPLPTMLVAREAEQIVGTAAPEMYADGAEAIGTALLLAAVVGSGIMADRLSGGNEAMALLANTIATAGHGRSRVD